MFNARGYRIGENHHRAKFSDHDIELMRDLHESYGIEYEDIADKFDCSSRFVGNVSLRGQISGIKTVY